MTQRLGIDEAKKYRFGDDLTVCAIDDEGPKQSNVHIDHYPFQITELILRKAAN